MKKIIQNAMKTPDGTIILSRSVHDYVEYQGYMVDGGNDYFRYGCPDGCQNKFEPLFITEDDTLETLKSKMVWGTYGKDGKSPLKWVKLIDCEDNHLKSILKIHIADLYKDVINSILEERKITLRIKKIKKIKNGI